MEEVSKTPAKGLRVRILPEDGDKIDRMVAAGLKFAFVDRIVHYYYPGFSLLGWH